MSGVGERDNGDGDTVGVERSRVLKRFEKFRTEDFLLY